jgi:hypothetical protein
MNEESFLDREMKMPSILRIILIVLFYCIPLHFVNGEEASQKNKLPEDLVNALASRNKEPALTPPDARDPFEQNIAFPIDYDNSFQEDVLNSWKELSSLGSDAFPALISHLGDERYSYTRQTSDGFYYNSTVGSACTRILKAHINAYQRLARPYFSGGKPAYFPPAAMAGNDLRKWFDDRKGKELWELQLEATKWAIECERKRGLEDIDYEPFGRMISHTEEELDRTLFGMELMVKYLETSKKPIIVEPQLPLDIVYAKPTGRKKNGKENGLMPTHENKPKLKFTIPQPIKLFP